MHTLKQLAQRVDLSFSINRLSSDDEIGEPILEVVRVGEYIDFNSSIDLQENLILDLYQEILDYAFFLQQSLVERYGTVEYLLNITFDYEQPKVQKVYLLAENGDKVKIHESRFGFR